MLELVHDSENTCQSILHRIVSGGMHQRHRKELALDSWLQMLCARRILQRKRLLHGFLNRLSKNINPVTPILLWKTMCPIFLLFVSVHRWTAKRFRRIHSRNHWLPWTTRRFRRIHSRNHWLPWTTRRFWRIHSRNHWLPYTTRGLGRIQDRNRWLQFTQSRWI